MKFPKTTRPDGVSLATAARVVFGHARNVETLCDEAVAGARLDLKKYQALIHIARQLRDDMDKARDADGDINAFVEAMRVQVQVETGRRLTSADMKAALKDLYRATAAFLPAAMDDQPKNPDGTLRLYRRDANGDIVGMVLDPAPASSVALVRDLRAAIEP